MFTRVCAVYDADVLASSSTMLSTVSVLAGTALLSPDAPQWGAVVLYGGRSPLSPKKILKILIFIHCIILFYSYSFGKSPGIAFENFKKRTAL